MKKQITLFMLLLAACTTFAASFSVRINSSKNYPAYATGEQDFQGRTQYKTDAIALNAGDMLTAYDDENATEWAIGVLDPYGAYANFTASANGIRCNTTGCYTVYIKLAYEDDMMYIEEATVCGNDDNGNDNGDDNRPDYTTSVPANCPDVMLQAFYWDSNSSSATHGDTKWTTLLAQAGEIGAYFDLVWLPPSAKSSGGVGYLPSQYSNQNSAWGTRDQLVELIDALHATDTKVIADIVVNHMNNKSTWCDFYDLDFDGYGKFQPDASWICKTDEVNSATEAGSCKGKATGASDAGYLGEANYAAARDLDHSSSQVQNMIKAYLLWLKNEIGYDGWRYDYCKGFLGKYINIYNSAARNYFSVTEFWDGNAATLQSYLNDAGNNTLTFDFATKYAAFNQGIAADNYMGCKGSGLLGAGKSRYAVTFVDNHDTYQRDNNEFCGLNNSMKYPEKILQANAFLLSMPGVPCVFWPHWVKFKEHIGPMVLARKATGVHSQSAVSDEAGNGYYKATITGTNGSIKLFLGPNSGYNTTPSGYTLADKGTNYAVYYQTNTAIAPQLIVSPGSSTFKDNNTGLSVTMQTIGGNGSATIYYTLDGSDPTVSSTKQTYTTPIVIRETTTLKAYAVAGGEASKVQTYTYTYKAPQTTPIIVRFWKPASWQKIYLYAWTTEGTTTNMLLGKWPGTEMVSDTEGWYSYEFSADIRGVNFIFNAGQGKDQTGDLYTDEDVCYSWSGGAEKLEPECNIPTAIDNVEAATSNISIYPNPVENTLYINTACEVRTTRIFSLTGEILQTDNNGTKEINVSALESGMYILQISTTNYQETKLFIKK
ncbi:MAG: alpha-amylase family glycosyl hydrolase [Paludibacter sp.]|nr:alpha-amylase family glycosyl hydrolase [Bacteroidales bacterium]MCM1069271.1 alpha-amylase family glycosyl hydrolase [Prevotella sp.]MCM1353746.1 alpha-amylase family glycosyl hydrolase [Bacteroides sp.]MCM1442186.1 alpha-amylase family glycosyl hydrolase [Muribaculum sp.]MCM1482148.1 alpha-amylase family glycosyl hydrolase [Paludibacter sp.]